VLSKELGKKTRDLRYDFQNPPPKKKQNP